MFKRDSHRLNVYGIQRERKVFGAKTLVACFGSENVCLNRHQTFESQKVIDKEEKLFEQKFDDS